MTNRLIQWGALICGVGVILGAFGAHLLKSQVTANELATFETGVRYQLGHGLAILLVAALVDHLGEKTAVWVSGLMLAGVVIFSGSLYALATTGIKIFGAITPIGGVCFIAAWLILAFSRKT